MKAAAPPKQFLDTSVARSIILGTSASKEYYAGVFGGQNKYISSFVEMEFRRSFVSAAVDLYWIFKLPTIKTIADLVAFVTNQYATSRLKAALQLASQLFQNRKIPFDSPSSKSKALYHFAELILRVQSRFHRTFKNVGEDSTKCARAAVPFNIKLQDAEAGFRKFAEEFGDTDSCRGKCSIDKAITKRHKKQVEGYIAEGSKVKSSKETDGFKSIADHLAKIVASKGKVCSCRMCGNIGDAIIALDCDRRRVLHHTDHSFDLLCPLVGQQHAKHPSETAIVRGKPTQVSG